MQVLSFENPLTPKGGLVGGLTTTKLNRGLDAYMFQIRENFLLGFSLTPQNSPTVDFAHKELISRGGVEVAQRNSYPVLRVIQHNTIHYNTIHFIFKCEVAV